MLLFVVLDIQCVTYFLTSITICSTRKLAICVRNGKWCQRFLWHLRLRNDLYCVEWGVKLYSVSQSGFLWHQLASASCEFYV